MKWAFDEYGALIVELLVAFVIIGSLFAITGIGGGGTGATFGGIAKGIALGLGLK